MKLTRRALLGGMVASCVPVRGRPDMRWGAQVGEVGTNSALLWSRFDRSARMNIEWSTSPHFEHRQLIQAAVAGPSSDHCAKTLLTGLPPGTRIHYRVWFDDSEWIPGSFTTAPQDPRPLLIAWSGDVNGQGWGMEAATRSMPMFRALLARKPDLFIHCGDHIYADVPIEPQIGDFRAFIDPKRGPGPAETLEQFYAAWRYARHSPDVRAFYAEVPTVSIWDDHEVTDNWDPESIAAPHLQENAHRAMLDHLPIGSGPMNRVIHYGPLVDIFLLDDRSARTTNDPSPTNAAMLGPRQIDWLIDELSKSQARWKIVATGQPLGDSVQTHGLRTGNPVYDAYGNANGPPTEREPELARLFGAIKGRVKNVVWVVADVHYGAATRFDPARAAFKDFDPFWELTAGPMHAATFAANPLDDTFGPEREWISADAQMFRGTPANGEQYSGLLAITAAEINVTWIDARGRDVHRLRIPVTPGSP
jgi:alkaline phosphatase D